MGKLIFKKPISRELNLEGANLEGANLQNANLSEASLQKADLEDANLQETNLEDACLRGAQGLTIERLRKAKTLHNAKLHYKLVLPWLK